MSEHTTHSTPMPDAGLTRTLVLWFPDWPVVAATHDLDLGDKPVAVVDKGMVYACSAASRLDGVRRGQRLREAQSRCPDLVVLPFDSGADSRVFDPVLAAVESVAPGVQMIQPGTCALRVRGPARYFGGEREAAIAITGHLRRLDVPDHRFTAAHLGVADGPFTAERAARTAHAADGAPALRVVPPGESASFLSDQPVSVLGQPDLADLLRRLGLDTLGAFARLSERDVLSRFGPIGAHAHRLARGADSRPVVARTPPPELTRLIEFDDPVERVDQVAFAVRAEADGFVSALATAGLVCTSLRVQVVAERGPGSDRCWLHPRWFDAADVVDRVRWQLQGDGRSESSLQAPVLRVALVPEQADPIGAHAAALWGNGPDEHVHRALSRVQSMLGHEAVTSAALGGGRGPADRQALVPWGDRPMPRWSTDAPWVGRIPDPPPTTVFPQPRPAQVLTADHHVVQIDGRGMLTGEPALISVGPVANGEQGATPVPIDGWAGPWPVSERWWDDREARRLARFQVVAADGSAWLMLAEDDCWWVEARYD